MPNAHWNEFKTRGLRQIKNTGGLPAEFPALIAPSSTVAAASPAVPAAELQDVPELSEDELSPPNQDARFQPSPLEPVLVLEPSLPALARRVLRFCPLLIKR